MNLSIKLLFIVAAMYGLSVTVYIEILNHNAGNILPRKEIGKWRTVPSKEIILIGLKAENESKLDDQLLYEKADKIAQNGKNSNALRNAVGTYGVLNYLVGVFVIIGAIITALYVKKPRDFIIIATMMISGGIIIIMALYRSYLTSLGW